MSSKNETAAKHDSSAADESIWTYEIPFQYAWVSAKAAKTAIDLEHAVAFIKGEFPSLARVRIDSAAFNCQRRTSSIHAWHLQASCPFCDAGKNQRLDSCNWVDVFKWDPNLEVDLLRGFPYRPRSGTRIGINSMYEVGGLEKALNWRFFSKSMSAWGWEKMLTEYPHLAEEELPHLEMMPANKPSADINVYGISLSDVLASLEMNESTEYGAYAELSNEHKAVAIAKEFGIEGYFDGLYRCSHCENVFAVAYRDPYDDTKEGRYKIMPEISEEIEKLVAKRGLPEPMGDESIIIPEHASTMSVKVSQDDGLITVRANIAGYAHEMIFDTELGGFLLDGEAYLDDKISARKPIPHLMLYRIYENPLVADCLVKMPGLVLKLLGMFSPLPDGVNISPGKLIGREYAINLLIAANRFVGYPAEFYNEMALSDTTLASTSGLAPAYPFGTGLPHDYSQIEMYFEQAGLTKNEQLKQLLLNRPQVVIDVLQNPELPFKSEEVLTRFFQLPRIEFILRMLRFYPMSIPGWRRLVDVKGEEPVFKFIEEQSKRQNVLDSLNEDEHFCEISNLLDALCDCVTDEQLASIHMDELYEDLEGLMKDLSCPPSAS